MKTTRKSAAGRNGHQARHARPENRRMVIDTRRYKTDDELNEAVRLGYMYLADILVDNGHLELGMSIDHKWEGPKRVFFVDPARKCRNWWQGYCINKQRQIVSMTDEELHAYVQALKAHRWPTYPDHNPFSYALQEIEARVRIAVTADTLALRIHHMERWLQPIDPIVHKINEARQTAEKTIQAMSTDAYRPVKHTDWIIVEELPKEDYDERMRIAKKRVGFAFYKSLNDEERNHIIMSGRGEFRRFELDWNYHGTEWREYFESHTE